MQISSLQWRTIICCIESVGDDDNSKISRDMLNLRAHSGPVYSVCFSQDNSFVLSASEDLTGNNFMSRSVNIKVGEYSVHKGIDTSYPQVTMIMISDLILAFKLFH